MTYKELHQLSLNMNNILNSKFKEQLLEIHPKAHLCYQSHYEKFTVSLYDIPYEESLIWNEVSTEHLTLLSTFNVNGLIEKLTHSITTFIVNQGPDNDNSIITTTHKL